MKINEIRALFAEAHSSLSAEAIGFLSQDTATVLGPIMARLQEDADLKASFRRGTSARASSIKIVTRAAGEVGAHPLLGHLSFVLSVADAFEKHDLPFQGLNLPLSFGVRVRQAAPKAKAKEAAPAAPAAPAAA